MLESLELLREQINICKQHKISDVRLNVNKIRHYKDLEKLEETINYATSNNIKIYLDLPYPFCNPRSILNQKKLHIKQDDMVWIDVRNYDGKSSYKYSIDNVLDYFSVGKDYFFSDGKGCMRFIGVDNDFLRFKALNSFELYHMKAVSADKKVKTELSPELYKIINSSKPYALMFSFVSDTDFLYEIKKKITYDFLPVFKIEDQYGIDNMENICKINCEIVIARGDLALETNFKNLLVNQKYISQIAKKNGRTVIVATDVFWSMSKRYIPSRADVIDFEIIRETGADIILNADIISSSRFDYVMELLK